MKTEYLTSRVPDLITVHTTVEIPAKSFAKLDSFDNTNDYFNVSKPDADNIPAEQVVIVPELIPANKTGVAYIGGIHVVLKTAGETIAAGDVVGTDDAQWTAINGSGFHVVDVFTNDIVVRMSASGSDTRKAFCKVAAGASSTIVCYLDTDTTGEEVTVTCNVVPASNLNEAAPRLADGTPIFVKMVNGTWECVQTFIGSEDCDCYEAP